MLNKIQEGRKVARKGERGRGRKKWKMFWMF